MLIEATRHQISSLIGLRGLFGRAGARGGAGAAVARIEALILVDFVVETVAKMAAQSIGLRPMHDVPLPVVLAELTTAMEARGVQLEYRAEVTRLHRIRNSAQHEFVSPDADALVQALADCGSFTRRLVNGIWGVEIDDLSEAERLKTSTCNRS